MKAASAVHLDGGALASGDVMSTEPIGRLHSIWEVYFQRIPSQLGVPVPNLLGQPNMLQAEGLNGISPVQFNAFLSYKPPLSSGISHHISLYVYIYLQSLSLYIYIIISFIYILSISIIYDQII